MPENPIPAPKPTPGIEPAEFNFDQATANPRIKRRSLKTKSVGLTKPEDSAVSSARELEREAPPRPESPAPAPQSAQPKNVSAVAKNVPVVVKAATATQPPPKTTPSALTSATAATPATPSSATGNGSTAARAASTASPHGTRPATLYYTSPLRKEATSTAKPAPAKTSPSPATSSPASHAATSPASSPSPMKTVSGTSSTSSTPGAAAASASSTAGRPAAAGVPRTSPQPDYRANVERQSREQKSVGSILSYIVYGLIAFFLLSAVLAGYGAKTIFDRLQDQSATVAELEQNFSDKNKELNAKLIVTQDTLTQVQAQTTREQDLILKQQDQINKLTASLNESLNALKSEKAARAQDSAAIRARIKELENRSPFSSSSNR